MNRIWFSSFLFLVLLVNAANSLRQGGKNVKTTYQRYYVYQQTATRVRKYKRTCTQTCKTKVIWCFSKKTKCTSYPYTVWALTEKKVSRARPVYSCYSGWLPRGDECTIPICTSVCRNGGTCISPNVCRCWSGWTGSSCRTDVDECRDKSNSCDYKPGCRNTQGSYRCTCRVGYNLASNQRSCIDVNECVRRTDTCIGANTYCVNNLGSYTCPCNSGYAQNPNVRTNSCKDINECDPSSDIIHNCQGTCHNLDGSYNCSCSSGHYLASNGRDCTDHDECARNVDGCQQNCINYPGGFNCTCFSGYRQQRTNIKSCEDINECTEKTSGCAQLCTNQIGSFNCSCSTGYYLDTDLKSCNDVDECSTDRHNCEHNCLNTLGSYRCTCRAGFDLLLNQRNCSGRPCFPIYTPVNGMKKCSGYTTEHICHFTCLPVYDLVGSKNRTCNSSKIWTEEEAKCKIIHCPTPTEPSNGFVYFPCATQFDSQCTVGCSSGYYINGTNKITCDVNGAWQPRNLTCKVDCPPGSFGEIDDNGIATCHPCPLGSYQTNSGQPSCVKCPKGFTTLNQGTYNKHQCKEPTRPTAAGTSKTSIPVITKMSGKPTVTEVWKKGAMVAGVVVAIVVLIVLFSLYRYRRRQQNKKPTYHRAEERELREPCSSESCEMPLVRQYSVYT